MLKLYISNKRHYLNLKQCISPTTKSKPLLACSDTGKITSTSHKGGNCANNDDGTDGGTQEATDKSCGGESYD